MIDLGDLEKRLNEDSELQKKFFNDPVEVFRQSGITLPPDKEKSLYDLVSQVKNPQASVAGSTALGILISISIPFDVADPLDAGDPISKE